jgi:hypothetical protein
MEKIKIFLGQHGPDELSKEINKWMEENKKIKIIERKVKINDYEVICIAIFYKE